MPETSVSQKKVKKQCTEAAPLLRRKNECCTHYKRFSTMQHPLRIRYLRPSARALYEA
jgi:hypothetical protein